VSHLPQVGTFAARPVLYPTDAGLRWRIERRVWPASLCLILHGVVVLIAIILYAVADAPQALFWTGLLTFALFIALGVVEARRSPAWLFNPLSYFFFMSSLGLGAGAMNAAVTYWSGSNLVYVNSFIPIEDIAFGYLLNVGGYFVFHLAIQLFRPPALGKAAIREKLDIRVCFLLFLIGCVAQYHPSFLSAIGLLSNPIVFAAHSALLMVALRTPGKGDMSRRMYWACMLGGTAMLLIVTFFRHDSKSLFALACLPALIALMNDPKTRRIFPMIAAPALIFFVTVVAPTVNYSRSLRDEYPDNAQRLRAAYRDVSIAKGNASTLDTLRDQGDTLFKRSFDQNMGAAFIVGEVRKGGFLDGASMEYLKAVFIPRFLWPDKPMMSRGYWFSAYVGVSEYEDEHNSSTAISPAGEMYWNFGIPGVVVGLFIMGGLFGILWRFSGTNPFERAWTALAYGFATLYIGGIEADCTGVCVVLIAMFLLLGVGIGVQRMAEYRTRVLAGVK
jgi:hypothetical protein